MNIALSCSGWYNDPATVTTDDQPTDTVAPLLLANQTFHPLTQPDCMLVFIPQICALLLHQSLLADEPAALTSAPR